VDAAGVPFPGSFGYCRKLDVGGALRLGFLEIIFVFLFIDMFDNIGTLVAVGKRAGLFDMAHRIPRVNRILFSECHGYGGGRAERHFHGCELHRKRGGVAAGGRTGVTAIVTGLLFGVTLFVAPAVGAIPAAANAPALIVVGSLMMSSWRKLHGTIRKSPSRRFLTIMTIPLTYSIANGPRVRLHRLHAAQGAARQVPPGELVRVCADGAVYSRVQSISQDELRAS